MNRSTLLELRIEAIKANKAEQKRLNARRAALLDRVQKTA
jgi:hypothetical protein